MGDIERTKIFFPDVNMRYTIAPSEKLSKSPIPLDFSQEHIQSCMAVGVKDALNALKHGPKVQAEAISRQYHNLRNGNPTKFGDVLNHVSQEAKFIKE